ncbi:Spore coat protein S [Clostridium sp. IBUN22A]|nr:Spore coat protein S [Clostridium sp. IBUN22A]
MNRIKYSEKEYLCDYDLSLNFFNAAGIKVNDIIPLRKEKFLFYQQMKEIKYLKK